MEPLAYWKRMDDIQDRSRPFFWTNDAQGYWVFTDHDVILEGLQHPELFSNQVIVPDDPDPPYKWIPIMLDPPEHTKWRQVLASYFSPGRVRSMEDQQRAFANELIDAVIADGGADFYVRYSKVFPTTIFLQIMGLPVEGLADFMRWEEQILHGTSESDPDQTIAYQAMLEVMAYFQQQIDDKRANPDHQKNDIVSFALDWKIDGEPIQDQDLLSCMLLLFMAGLDTVAANLSYIFLHLATHDADRQRIVDDPSSIPAAVEELMRTYPIVQTARKATQDVEFHGCPVKAGDMVAFPLGFAGRDESHYDGAKEVDLDREGVRHLGFGAGPHRCLGSHLARQEMIVTLEEWHRRIPHYRLVEGADLEEHGGGVYSLESLPLEWDVR
ncbi:MAG: cytochrome P450 [Ilumatobacteraceae bacterium]